MITKYFIRWMRWLVERRPNRTCFRGTSWITKSNFWNPDLPYYLQLVWSSQIDWPIGLNAAEQQILVGFMRAKWRLKTCFFWMLPRLEDQVDLPSQSATSRSSFRTESLFSCVQWTGRGSWLVCKFGRGTRKVDDLQISCMDYSDCAGNSVGPERAEEKTKRSVNECALVSGSPFFPLAIAEDSKWPGL